MTGVPVLNTDDGRVLAQEPPRHSVRVSQVVKVGPNGHASRTEWHEVWIGATEGFPRADVIVRSANGMLRVLLGEPLPSPLASWHLVQPDDALLAVVTLPVRTSTVLQSFILDCRAFG